MAAVGASTTRGFAAGDDVGTDDAVGAVGGGRLAEGKVVGVANFRYGMT